MWQLMSPLDSQMNLSKKRMAARAQKKAETASGLRVSTQGLNLMSQVVTCDEGMSPLMERFTRNIGN